MRKLALLALFAASCSEPPKTLKMNAVVRGLVDLYAWDPSTEGAGQYGYEAVLSAGPEVIPSLIAHLTDETPTALYDRVFDIKVTLGDVCFYLLLKLTGIKREEFAGDGAFMLSHLPNPIFCIRWKEGMATRRLVQAHFLRLLPPPED